MSLIVDTMRLICFCISSCNINCVHKNGMFNAYNVTLTVIVNWQLSFTMSIPRVIGFIWMW